MRTLAIETATEACSVALFDGDELVARDHQVLGRGHAERLVPMIAALPEKGNADRILVSLGPGSFTGVRIGIATARALGIAWGADVVGYPTLALVASMARADAISSDASPEVTVCMNAGHGEWFVQDFSAEGFADGPAVSVSPEDAAERTLYKTCAGNRAEQLVAIRDDGASRSLETLPDAARVMLVPDRLLTSDLSPVYGRGPDAKLPGA